MSKLIHYSCPAGSILLPSGYTRLSYIQFTGSLWIDSGTLSTDVDEVYYEVSPDSIPTSGDMDILASTRSASSNNYKIYAVVQTSGKLKMYYGSTDWDSTTKMVVGGRYIIKGILKESQLKLWINGNLEIDKAITGGPTAGVKNTIGAWNGNGNIHATFKGKIYFAKFLKNGLIVRDFVPVKKSDGTIGLLDLVNNTFYGNSGTGTFIAGPECPQGFPTSEYCLVETHSAVTLTSDVIPCYRRSDGKPGKYTLSTNTFTEVLGTIGPSITFGWGEVMNGVVGFPQTSAYDSNIYYEPDGSAWIRVFHHNNPASNKFSSSDTFTTSFKKNDNMWWDMPKFNLITDNIYDIMVKYKITSNASEIKHRWVLYTNPMSGTFENTTYDKVTKSYYYGSTIIGNSYGGFYRDISNHAYIVHNNNFMHNWFGAIGCWSGYNNGIPGPNGTTITSGYIDVYMHIPNHPAIPHNISIGDGRNGEKNGAFIFNGLDTYMTCKTPDLASVFNSLNWTVAFWCYPTNLTNTWQIPISYGATNAGNLYLILHVRSNTIMFSTYGTDWSVSPTLVNNTWYHIAYVYRNGLREIWLNGVKLGEKAYSITNIDASDTSILCIGKDYHRNQYPYYGRIYDLQIWNEVKNPAELM